MNSGIEYALLSLVFAACNDVVFKRYALSSRSRGMLVMGIGLVWFCLQYSSISLLSTKLITFSSFDQLTLRYGLGTGLLLTASNLLLLESLKHINISLGSTIYRLNTIGVVLLSLLLLNESLQSGQWLGLLLGILAVLMLYHRENAAQMPVYILLAIAASVLRALYGVFSKQGLQSGADLDLMILVTACCWFFGGALYAIFRERRFNITYKKIQYAMLSGILVYLIVQCLLLAIETGQASIVIPVANMSFIVALLLSVLLGMERITLKKSVATGIAACSIVLLSL